MILASNACQPPSAHTALTPTPHHPYCLHSLAVDGKFLKASNACPNPLRPQRPHHLHPHSPLLVSYTQKMPNATLLVLTNTAALEDWELAALPAAIPAQRAPSVRSRKGEAFKGGPPLPPTLLRRVTRGLADARDARPCGVSSTDVQTRN